MTPEAKAAAVASAPMRHPADMDGLDRALADAGMDAADIVAVWVKTEGNGLSNDFTRPYTETVVARWLAARRGIDPAGAALAVQILVSGGAEGVISPHVVAIGRGAPADRLVPGARRLVVGTACAAASWTGSEDAEHARFTAGMVRAAMADAGLASPGDVHGVVVRAPSRPGDPDHARRVRGSGALGIALALDEGPAVRPNGDLLDRRMSSARAFVVARPGDEKQQVVLLGNGAASRSRYAAAHSALADPLDTPGVVRMLASLGLDAAPQLDPESSARVVAVLVKGDPPPQGLVRGRRHVMSSDADVAGHRHARAAFGAVVAGVVGHTAILAGAGAEHHGPPGGGLVFAIARME